MDSAKLKVERAKKHIRDLDIVKRKFLETDPYKITSQHQPEMAQLVHYVGKSEPVLADIALIAGDAIHNLRSSLDHLISQLFRANKLRLSKRTGYPVCESREKYVSEGVRKIKRLRPEIREVIDASEPYPGGKGEYLWAIHDLDIEDKHRLFIEMWYFVDRVGRTISPERWQEFIPNVPMQYREVVSWLPAPATRFPANEGEVLWRDRSRSNTNQDIKFGCDIAFREPEILKGKPIVETLMMLAKAVDGLISSFTPFLV